MSRQAGPFQIRLPAFLLCLWTASAAFAQARDLHWRALDVRANLDGDGALHVVERHAMVFSGDWNGGERVFRLFPGQRMTFEGLRRFPPEGEPVPLKSGDLSAVDQFGWHDPVTLRWRSRLPSDPEFQGTELVYEIAYTLSGILAKEGSLYVLDHDFAFPDRAGRIERFTLELSLDPAWRPREGFSGSLERRALVPGEGVVLRLPLAYAGTGRPAAGRTQASRIVRVGLLALLVLATLLLYLRFRSREKALGRFAPLASPEAIDEAWLDENLFALSPEEAGALWDEKIGPPEVAAVLARLAGEKKIQTEVSGKKLAMRRLGARKDFPGYDRELVDALFFGDREETDTDAIRSHYKKSGFDPASKIRPGLEKKLKTHPDFQDRSPRPSRWPTLGLFLSGAVLLVGAVVVGGEEPGPVIGIGITNLALYGLGVLGAFLFQKRVDRVDASSVTFLWVPVLILYFAWEGLRGDGKGLLLSIGVLLLRIGIIMGIFNVAMTRNGPKRIARRKALTAARAFFARELDRPLPRLKDGWFPYVVAFGLTGEADRWFRAHGASATAGSGAWSGGSSASTSTGSSSSGSGGWTGGGCSFGGAGASSSWAVAAGALAAGVSAPSSSSGGGGGGGGGGGSGGGGGGGW